MFQFVNIVTVIIIHLNVYFSYKYVVGPHSIMQRSPHQQGMCNMMPIYFVHGVFVYNGINKSYYIISEDSIVTFIMLYVSVNQ